MRSFSRRPKLLWIIIFVFMLSWSTDTSLDTVATAATTAPPEATSVSNNSRVGSPNLASLITTNSRLLQTATNPNLSGVNSSAQYAPLRDYYFYIDAGHNPASMLCNEHRGTGPHWGAYEGDLTVQVALKLRDLLIQNGALPTRVYLSRSDPNKGVDFEERYSGAAEGGTGDCKTLGNNTAFWNNGGPTDKWRLISIHFNGSSDASVDRVEVFRKVPVNGEVSLASHFAESMSYQLHRAYPHPTGAYWGNWTRAYETAACDPHPVPCELGMIRETYPRQYEDTSYPYHPGGYNILTESGYISNYNFNQWIQNANNQLALAKAHLRGLVDFFVVGKAGSINFIRQETINEYRNSIQRGMDPGIPFNNGGGYFSHEWVDANVQEFRSDAGVHGSILECIYRPTNPCSWQGGGGYYVRQPIWDTYVLKGGPSRNGPGRPFGADGREHPWRPPNGPHGPRLRYDKVNNFENGAIVWNAVEGGMRWDYDAHAIFLPNCRAYDIYHSEYITHHEGMVNRFSISNDFNTHLSGARQWTDGGYHHGVNQTTTQNGLATRAELVQSLIWSEGYSFFTTSGWEFSDIQGHWARPWIRTAASRGIANGYSDNTFRPDEATSRQQFSKMITIARGWPLITPAANKSSSTCGSPPSAGYYSFPDVCAGTMNNGFYSYIETVRAHNAIGGYPDGYFRPANNITRAQMSKIINSALNNDGHVAGGCWGMP